jgi:translation elongation factor EF-G
MFENRRIIAIIGSVDAGVQTLMDIIHCYTQSIRPIQYFSQRFEGCKGEYRLPNFKYINNANGFTCSHFLHQSTLFYFTGTRYQLLDACDLRLVDSVFLVIDVESGVTPFIRTAIQYIISIQLKVILVINKMDILLKSTATNDEIYQKLKSMIDEVNAIINSFGRSNSIVIDPYTNVVFASALHSWTFSLDTFAHLYEKKFGTDKKNLKPKLYGDNYFCLATRKWCTDATKDLGFSLLVLKPLRSIYDAVKVEDMTRIQRMADAVQVTLTREEREETGPRLLRAFMSKFLSVTNLLSAAIEYLPSPSEAQLYRYESLYTGDTMDKYSQAIKESKADGTLIIYISRCFIYEHKTYALGRILSGTLIDSQYVNILNPKHKPSEQISTDQIQEIVTVQGRSVEVLDIPHVVGNLIGLLYKNSSLAGVTVVQEGVQDMYPIANYPLYDPSLISVNLFRGKTPRLFTDVTICTT